MDNARRRARRAYILEHHPDRGGDPDAFVTGLAAHDEITPSAPNVRVVVVPSAGWARSLLTLVLTVGNRGGMPRRVR